MGNQIIASVIWTKQAQEFFSKVVKKKWHKPVGQARFLVFEKQRAPNCIRKKHSITCS